MTVAQPLPQAPLPAPLPEPPLDDFFSPAQWSVLFALIDGALPSITPETAVTDGQAQIRLPDDDFDHVLDEAINSLAPSAAREDIRAFLTDRPIQDPRFKDNLLRTLAFSPPSQQKRLGGLLRLMATRPGSYFITGHWQPIYNQPAHVREAILKKWFTSSERWRTVAKTLTALAVKSNCQTNPIFRQLSGYSDVPKDWQAKDSFDYSFLQLEPGDEPHVIETDVVVIGSGCGGGVSAKNLAEAGHRVLVVDKAYHYPSSHLPMAQDTGSNHLFDNGGFYITDDSACNVAAGSSWGGGGTVNWSVCLKPQDFVRKEWADAGLPFFTSSAFDECLDRVWEFQGAGTDKIRHNHRNRVLLHGSEKLGWSARPAPQNTAGKEHYCGQCHLGCGLAEKRGPAIGWLPEAAKAGAQFMEGFQVDKILFSPDGQSATGIEGEWVSKDIAGGVSGPDSGKARRRVVVKAKKVILAAGSLWSPLVLAKSGMINQHLGANLHLHPCNFVSAVYKEELKPWEGGIITSYSPEFENVDGSGYGVKLETTCMVPYAILSMVPWNSGLGAKLDMIKYRHMNGWISLTRDRDTGKVYPDPTTGRPRIDYTPSDYDRAHTLQGVEALAKICYVTGAIEIRPLLPGLEPFVRTTKPSSEHTLEEQGPVTDPETSDAAFAAWLGRVREVNNKPPTTSWSSAHQMGTCRMSASRDDGVVDEKGRVWGTENLYVADSSVFPSASGVNPMITVMAIADWISRGVDADLRA
ncbi:hypothetical protein FZEAL_5240 [Fusarium zealandicum]|uniref:Long-chain-alcohol oxidase n=1 Tax=Fusarium zealandicum TaxID=1053134 RepID=A0A8H4XKT2_9HYPO|nr:hypothetical protein FZEAL_5240 [Fusarium zealandicum]